MTHESAGTHAEVRLRRAFELHRLGMSLRATRGQPLPPALVFGPLLHTLLRAWQPLDPRDEHSAPRWTDTTRDGLLATQPLFARLAGLDDAALTAYPERPRGERGFGFEFGWGTWPEGAFVNPTLRPARPWEILFAAETAWGGERGVRVDRGEVLWDVRKLLDLRARYRLLVYGGGADPGGTTSPGGIDDDILALVTASAHAATEAERMLFVAVPWGARWTEARAWRVRREAGGFTRTPVPSPRL